ncbi:hypothetical protein OAJ79_03460 [Verrucomicrobia bacterium]|nr:hypothetical protein [Verrucomicrobiota bacterium]
MRPLIKRMLVALGALDADTEEMELARADLEKSDNVVAGIQELLLALLNTKEFIVNH